MRDRSGFWGWLIVGILLLVAIATCPDKQDHAEAIQKNVMEEYDPGDNSLTTALGNFVLGAALNETLKVKNYWVFSIGKIHNPFTGESKTVSYGLFGHVFVTGDDD